MRSSVHNLHSLMLDSAHIDEGVLPCGRQHGVLDSVHNLHSLILDIAYIVMPFGGHHGVLGSVLSMKTQSPTA